MLYISTMLLLLFEAIGVSLMPKIFEAIKSPAFYSNTYSLRTSTDGNGHYD